MKRPPINKRINMKKCILLASALMATALISGCASSIPQGVFYTDVKLPVSASDKAIGTKVGKSQCKSYFGVVTVGDASIETAKKNGGITKVSSVDWKAKSVLGIIGEYECTVRGE